MKSILKNTNFVLLWTVQVLEQFGDSLVILSLLSWAKNLHEKGTAAFHLSLLMLWIAVPIILIGPVAGVLVDRMKKKTMLAGAAAARALCILAISMLMPGKQNGAYIYFMVFMISSVSQFFGSAKSTFIPLLVPRKDLIKANSMTAASVITAQIFTYALGGFAVTGFGHQKVIFAAAIVYFAVAAVAMLISSAEKIKKKGTGRTISGFVGEFIDGLRSIYNSPGIIFMVQRVLVLVTGAGFVFVSLTSNFLGIIIKASGINIAELIALGIMQAVLGLGLVAGVFFIQGAVKRFREQDLVRVVFPLLGLPVVLLYFFRNYCLLLLVAVAAGMAGVIVISLTETSIQKNTPERLRGRVFAVYYILRTAGLALASALTGAITGIIHEEEIVLLTGILMAVYGVVGLITAGKKIRAGG